MITSDLNKLPLLESWFEEDPGTRGKVAFPLFGATGTENLAVVYFELEPGKAIGEHTDSAEEIVLILDGTVEASLGSERGALSRGQMALVPAMVPHNLRNTGATTAKVIGFFASASVASTFSQPIMPLGRQQVGTPPVPRTDPPATWAQVVEMMMQNPPAK